MTSRRCLPNRFRVRSFNRASSKKLALIMSRKLTCLPSFVLAFFPMEKNMMHTQLSWMESKYLAIALAERNFWSLDVK